MCGICGIYNLDGKPVSDHLIRDMASTMTHRGPDGEGIFVQGSMGLGHRRLSIIDLQTGDQPMPTADGGLRVVLNGEIYNFLELKKTLEAKGHVFRTRSDTESILHSYREWGLDFVHHLRGMFSIALWDAKKTSLILARDRLGKKPLYYYLDSKRLVFASELKALRAIPEIPGEIDPNALDAYLSFGYVPSPLSIFKHIQKLPPAHMAVCSAQGFKTWRYWELEMRAQEGSLNEKTVLEELEEIFDESVRLRLISDVPLGAFLSGGVDSSAVVASMAAQNPDSSVKTVAVGFSVKEFDELEYARIVAEKYRTEHSEFIVEPDALSIIEKIAWHFDEPFADSSAIPTYYVSKMAREKVTVALSGDGGDETFAGYVNRYSMTAFEDRVRGKIPAILRKTALKGLGAVYPRLDNLPRPLRLKSFLRNLSLTAEQAYFRDMSFYFRPEDKLKLYQKDFSRQTGQADSFDFLGRHFQKISNPDQVSRAQYVDIMTYLPEDILVKVDRMSMANSLEVRAPILDHRLMEYAASLPSWLKLKNGQSKYIFKKMNESRLPPAVLYRKKQGFCVPLAQWLRHDLREYARDKILGGDNGLNNYFESDCLRNLWQKHQDGHEDNSNQIWALLMLGIWHDQCT